MGARKHGQGATARPTALVAATQLVGDLKHALMDVLDGPVDASFAPMRAEKAPENSEVEVTSAQDIGMGGIALRRDTGGFNATLDPILVDWTDEALDAWIDEGPAVAFVHARGTAAADIVPATVVHDGVTHLRREGKGGGGGKKMNRCTCKLKIQLQSDMYTRERY